MHIHPFTIAVSDADIADLHSRIANTRFPDASPAPGWQQGTELTALRELVADWRRFDWRAAERALNLYPQFMADIDGQKIHFIHQRAASGRGRPLILTHGWPGSFVEFLRILPMLTDPVAHGGAEEDAFDVVIPSLPGYGFSGRPTAVGCNPFAIAGLWNQLMEGLGYTRYMAQGGDWGAGVSTCLAQGFPERVSGLHLNFIPGTFAPKQGGDPLSVDEQAFLLHRKQWADTEGAYGHVQGTRPQTLAYGLVDSPAGLAAWIAEKFRAWSDCDGDLKQAGFSRDELLANLSIYWYTGSIASSMRLYWETRSRPLRFAQGETIAVPLAVALFPKELLMPPQSWVARVFTDVRRWTVLPRGGHFAALEEPTLLVQDIRNFARDLPAG